MRRRWGVWGLAAAILLPLLVGVVAVAGDDWHPTGDMAQAELHVRGFLAHPPLVGAAGRIGTIAEQGSHPGPSLWFLLLPTYRLLGQTGFALEAGVAVVAAAAGIAAVVLARRRGGGGWALAVGIAATVLLLVRSNGPAAFTEPWNPWLALLPFLLYVLLVWAVLGGWRAGLPLALAVGSHCVQCHVGYAVVVAAVGVVAVGWALRERWWRTLGLAALALAVLWAPPIVEQLTASGRSGNLSILLHHFGTPQGPTVGVRAAVKATAGQLNVAGPWLVGEGHQPTDDPSWLGFVAMVGLWAGAAAVAWRRRLLPQLRLHAVLAVAWAAGLVSMARVFGEFYDYVIRWATTLAALVALAVVWTAWGAWRPAAGWARRAGAAAVAGLALFAAVGATGAESSGLRNSELVAALVPELLPHLDPDGRYLVRWSDTVSLDATGVGVLLELERRGVHVGADPHLAAAVLPHRVLAEADATAVLQVLVGDVDPEPGAVEVAGADARTPAERARVDRIAAEADALLLAAGLDELTPVTGRHVIASLVDPRLPEAVRPLLLELLDLGLPAVAYLVEPA